MFVVLGGVVVIVAVLVGFSMAGGKVAALIHLSEFVTIGGASLGALLTMAPKKVLTDLIRSTMQAVKGSPYNKQTAAEMLKLLYALARIVRKEGLLALEPVIGSLNGGSFFDKFPAINRNHHAKEFLREALSRIADGKVDPKQLAAELEAEIEVINREHHAAVSVLHKTADALPGFGIVAAVLGIVVTMQAIGGPVDQIGYKVGAALVGTFLGILMSYGFFAPLAGRMEFLGQAELIFFRSMSAGLVGICEGLGPRDVVSCARRALGSDARPTKEDLGQIIKEGESI